MNRDPKYKWNETYFPSTTIGIITFVLPNTLMLWHEKHCLLPFLLNQSDKFLKSQLLSTRCHQSALVNTRQHPAEHGAQNGWFRHQLLFCGVIFSATSLNLADYATISFVHFPRQQWRQQQVKWPMPIANPVWCRLLSKENTSMDSEASWNLLYFIPKLALPIGQLQTHEEMTLGPESRTIKSPWNVVFYFFYTFAC